MVGEDEATLKKIRRNGNIVYLMPENPEYEVLSFIDEEISQLRILCLAVGYTHPIK